MFVIILLIILIIIYIFSVNSNYDYESKNKENFNGYKCKNNKYPFNPPIQTPQSNYEKIKSNIASQQTFKKKMSVALAPTPTIHCPELKNKTDCNKYGCNWFGSSVKRDSDSFCSSTYPIQF